MKKTIELTPNDLIAMLRKAYRTIDGAVVSNVTFEVATDHGQLDRGPATPKFVGAKVEIALPSQPGFVTIVRCPCCNVVFEVIRHHEPKPHAQSVSMIAGDMRRLHGQQSPECAQNLEWAKGWSEHTTPVVVPG